MSITRSPVTVWHATMYPQRKFATGFAPGAPPVRPYIWVKRHCATLLFAGTMKKGVQLAVECKYRALSRSTGSALFGTNPHGRGCFRCFVSENMFVDRSFRRTSSWTNGLRRLPESRRLENKPLQETQRAPQRTSVDNGVLHRGSDWVAFFIMSRHWHAELDICVVCSLFAFCRVVWWCLSQLTFFVVLGRYCVSRVVCERFTSMIVCYQLQNMLPL